MELDIEALEMLQDESGLTGGGCGSWSCGHTFELFGLV
jgi:hypothetical protein